MQILTAIQHGELSSALCDLDPQPVPHRLGDLEQIPHPLCAQLPQWQNEDYVVRF